MVKDGAFSLPIAIAEGGYAHYPSCMRIKFTFPILACSLALSACGVPDMFRTVPDSGPVTPLERPPAVAPTGPTLGAGRSAAALDRTSEAEKKAALAVPASASEAQLGKVAVSLGSPVEQGIWLRSSLVSAPAKGRVVTAAGKSVAVDLLPGAGAAQLSLAAYRALGLNLTDLPQVTVYK